MPQKNANKLFLKDFRIGLNYKPGTTDISFKDAENCMIAGNKLEKRYGIDFLIKDELGDSPNFSRTNSLSYFKNDNGDKFYFFKSGNYMYRIDPNDPTNLIQLDSALNEETKHRGVTLNNRHFFAIESNGLYQYQENDFTIAGQQSPSTPNIAAASGGTLTGSYQVKISFYSSRTGYESLPCSATGLLSASSQKITVSNIPTSATNKTIDKVYIYLKKSTSSTFNYVGEVNLGTTTFDITQESSSSQVPSEVASLYPGLGAKYLTIFDQRLIVAGADDFKSDVFFSEQDDPESFDSAGTRLFIAGDGPITGLATGLYNNTVLDPYLVIFKEKSTWIYSEIGGQPSLVRLNNDIGCVSHDTIVVKNGNVYFMSRFGFYGISNGRFISKDGQPYVLGGTGISDIFEEKDFIYAINKSQISKCFSTYFHTQDLYMTFIAESGSNEFYKCYAYNFATDTFMRFKFPIPMVDAVTGEETSGEEVVIMLQSRNTVNINRTTTVFKFGKNNDYKDVYYPDEDNAVKHEMPISAYAILNYLDGQDFDATYNFREFLLRLKRGQAPLTIKTWKNFTLQDMDSQEMDVPNPDNTFILDESYLDIDSLGEGRDAVTARVDLNQVGENLSIGIFEETIDNNIVILSAQLNFSKNGNRNV